MPSIIEILGKSTPVSEVLAEKLGYVKAAIACRIFFYQQLKDGVCRASVATIAKKLGMANGTVSTNLNWLLDNGYIVNTKPLVKGNRTNHFKVTKLFYEAIEHSGDERHIQEMNVTHSGDERKRSKNKEDTKELSSTNVEDAAQKTTSQNDNQPIKEEKEQKDVSPAQPDSAVSPPPVKPKTIIKDCFCELTKRKMPNNKKQSGYWWSQFGELLYIANDDYELACKALEEVVPYMRAHNLSISGPQSVIGLCGEVISGQKLNGHTITTEIAPGQDEKWSNLF